MTKRNITKVVLLLVIFSTALKMNAQTKFKKTKPYDGITVSIPVSFVEMKEEDVAIRYITPKKPTIVYTDENLEVDFDINVTRNFWGQNDLQLLKDFYKSSIYNSHKQVEFIKDDIVELKKREYVWLEYKSSIPGGRGTLQKHYTAILFTVVQNRILVFSFRCPQNRMDAWKDVAYQSLNSIKVSDHIKVDELLEKEIKGDDTNEDEKGNKKDGKDGKDAENPDAPKKGNDTRPNKKVTPKPDFENPEVDPVKRKEQNKGF